MLGEMPGKFDGSPPAGGWELWPSSLVFNSGFNVMEKGGRSLKGKSRQSC